MNESTRILTLTGTPYPKALVQSIDAAAGVLTFAWLNSSGVRVDSGGSVARFSPPAPIPQAEDYTGPTQYPELSDEALADSIKNSIQSAPSVPQVVRSAALRYVLNAQSLRSAVEAAIAQADQNAKDAWEFETNIRRDHPLVSQLGSALNLNSSQIDALFVAASAL